MYQIKNVIMMAIVFLLLLYFPFHANASEPQGVLSGKVIEASTGISIPGATIYIPELRRGTVTDKSGNYSISNLPASKVKIQVTCVGYQMIVEIIDMSIVSQKDFVMNISVAELNEFVVTGISKESEKSRVPTPILTIPTLQLQQMSTTNIIGAIATQPGLSAVTTGAAIAKPVIRGLGYNRILIVNDGIRQEGQQWGDEHGIEVDEFSVNRIEILKGPSSLMYGSDAMAGVINFLPAPTLPEGVVEGKILANYQTNNGQIGYSVNLAGNKKDITWDLRFSNKMAHAYKNKYDGYVLNSGFSEYSFGGITGINRKWGYSHLHFSYYNLQPGIIEGERDSLTGEFVKPIAVNDSTINYSLANENDFTSYNELIPYQMVNHYKVVLNNNFLFGEGSLKAIAGWQQNRRKEFGNIFSPDDFGLYFLLNTFNYNFKYDFPVWKLYNLSVGVNGMLQSSQNKGTEYLVPEYELFDIGVFALLSKSFDKLDISGGLRYDVRVEQGDDLFLDPDGIKTAPGNPEATQRFVAFDSDFSGISGSLGATYRITQFLFTKLNLSRGFRAPNIAELGSNGEHEGSGRYEIGDASLKAEHSMQWDFTFGINSDHVTGELNLFTNTIDNFIFKSKLENFQGTDSLNDGLEVYKYAAGNANLTGGEINFDIHPHPLDWLHFENSFAYVKGIQKDQPASAKYLPLIPAPKFSSEVKATTKKLNKNLVNAYLDFGIDYYFEQNNVYSLNNTETPTDDYYLLNIGAGTDLVIKNKTVLSIYLSLNNLLDEAYQNHLSRLKYAPLNYATGRTGVFEMGRNFSFKIIVPIHFSSL